MTKKPDDYARDLNKALKFTAGHGDVENLLGQLMTPEHQLTRAGSHKGDHLFRVVTADALQDVGRDDEAALLRDTGRHVIVHGGKVVPARWTLRPLNDLRDDVSQDIFNAGDWEAAHPPFHVGTPHELQTLPRVFLPDASFQDAIPFPKEPWESESDAPTHDYLRNEDAAAHPERIHKDPETGLPLIRGSTFTCHDFECPVHEAPRRWAELLNDTVFHPGNNVVNHLDETTRQRIARAVTERAANLNLEEPEPQPQTKRKRK